MTDAMDGWMKTFLHDQNYTYDQYVQYVHLFKNLPFCNKALNCSNPSFLSAQEALHRLLKISFTS